MRARVTLVGIATGTLLLSGAVSGAVRATPAAAATCTKQAPGAYPNDPGYSAAENQYAGNPATPHTWDGESWYLYGCIPQDVQYVSTDPQGMAGMAVDRTWATYTRGRDDLLVAYMEGGVNWRISRSCELRLRSYLNRGELPYPENAAGKTRVDLGLSGDPYDLNGDGVLNVDDYATDPRVLKGVLGFPKSPAGGPYLHHVCSPVHPPGGVGSDITPEDLIVAFGHCRISGGAIVGAFPCDQAAHVDNDGNGYPNDISGWNFNRDTNDPQTDQSIYAHFTGESAQLVGEGNNGFGGIGMCPLCRYLPIKAGDEAIDRPDRVAEAIIFAVDSGVKVFDGTDASLGLAPEVAAAVDYAYYHGMVVVWASNDFESADHTDGMWLPHVWPGNSLTGNHSTRGNATCHVPPTASSDALCPFVLSNGTFLSRSSLTSYGPHSLFSVPNNDGSTSTGTPTQAGVAALVMSEGLNAWHAGHIAAPLNADEVKQVVRSTALPISAPCAGCFSGVSGSFNRMYGYGRPNVFAAAQAVDHNLIPPTVDIRTPSWYQEVDPFTQPTLSVTTNVAAPRSPSYAWSMQVATGPDPGDAGFVTFATGTGTGPQTVGGSLDMTALRSFASTPYALDVANRTSIEKYDVTIRVQVTDSRGLMGEDRRAFHARHDSSEQPGFPVHVGASGEASPTMADIEGRGWLDTIVPTSDGQVHAYRPDGTEAPGFPVHTNPPPGMNPAYDMNYLGAREWRDNLVPRPHDPVLSAAAVGDLRHDGALEIVIGTLSGYTYAWDGAGRLLPGFPLLDGSPQNYHQSVPPPDTAYSFNPENVAGPSPVLADLRGDRHLDIIQAAGDDHIYAWEVTATGVSAVPGWPVCTVFDPVPGPGQPCREQAPPPNITHTHDVKIVPTPAIVDLDKDGHADVVVGLDDSTWDRSSPLGSNKVTTYIEAFYGEGTTRTPTGMATGWPVAIPGLIQGYGVAQDFVTQGTESPVVYDTPGEGEPMIVVNANLFLPFRVDARTRQVSSKPFAGASIPPTTSGSPTPNLALVPFTTSPTVGRVLPGTPAPQIFQAGSTAVDVAAGITQTPGLGTRVDNGLGAWDPTTGNTLTQFDTYIQGLGFFTAPAVADVTGDGVPDIVQAADSAAVMGFDGTTGQAASGWPKWSGGFSLFTPAVGDVSGTGTVEVAAMTREGYLHMWRTPGRTSADNQAWHWHQDDRNTGHYGTDTRPPAAVADLGVTCTPAGDTLTFTAPGDDWNSGTAARYQAFRSGSPITQDTLGSSTFVPVALAPHAAGSHETLLVPHAAGQCDYAVRAIDHAGNIGPVRMPSVGGGSAAALALLPASRLPNLTAALAPQGGVAAGALALLAGEARRRRRGVRPPAASAGSPAGG